jgi:hypothetical protein
MGLRDMLRGKKSAKADAELVGGLTDTDWETNLQSGLAFGQEPDEHQDDEETSPVWPASSGSAEQDEEEGEGQDEGEEENEQQGSEKKDSGPSSLDIFTMETGEDEGEGIKLARQLPAVDIHDLLRECQEIAATLRGT